MPEKGEKGLRDHMEMFLLELTRRGITNLVQHFE